MLLCEMLFSDAASIIPCLHCTHTKTHLSASLLRSPSFPRTIQQINTPLHRGPPKALHQKKSPHMSFSHSGDMSPSNSVHRSISMVVVVVVVASMLKKSPTLMSKMAWPLKVPRLPPCSHRGECSNETIQAGSIGDLGQSIVHNLHLSPHLNHLIETDRDV